MDVCVFNHSLMEFIYSWFLIEVLEDRVVFAGILQLYS